MWSCGFAVAVTGSPFKACIINPERVAPIGGWLNLFNGQPVVRAIVNKQQMIDFETCQAGHGICPPFFVT